MSNGTMTAMASRVLTDAPAVVELKREFGQLEALHERVQLWPDDLTRTIELANITRRKREIAAEIFQSARELH